MVGGREDVVEIDIGLSVCKTTTQRLTTLLIFPNLIKHATLTFLAASSCLSSTYAFHQTNITSFLACLYQLLFQDELFTRLMDDGHTLTLANIDFAEVFISANHRFQPTELKYFGIGTKVLNWVNWNTNRCRSFSRGALFKWCPTRFRYWPVTVLIIHNWPHCRSRWPCRYSVYDTRWRLTTWKGFNAWKHG